MGITKNYGFRAGYAIDDNFIMPKCVGVFEASMEHGVRFLMNIDTEYDSATTDRFRARHKEYYGDEGFFYHPEQVIEKAGGLNFINIPQLAVIQLHSTVMYWGEHITGFHVYASHLIQAMCEVCGIDYDSEIRLANGADNFAWRRFALAYTVIGPAYGHVEFSRAAEFGSYDVHGMGLYITFRKPVEGSIIRIYVYDMSSLSLNNFEFSAVVGSDINYGARVIKYNKSTDGMFDTISDADLESKNVESFNSSAFYLRLAGSVNMKQWRYDMRFLAGTDVPPHPYGLLSGQIVEYKGVNSAKYSDFGIDNQKVAIFVHSYINEWHDLSFRRAGGHEYFPSFSTAFPPNERDAMYCTSLTLDMANGGPIIQQMFDHMFFADISQIDKHLKDKFNYDPRARFLSNEGN
ncbi:TPA: hypothetical protein RNX13_001734 [Pasteurella multocida]|nr:hypothetical protein [Pasteurella multocida]